MKEYTGKKIENLYAFLKATKENEIVVRTTRVAGCWYDNEFDANAAGFMISRFTNKEMEVRHEFSECYRIVRK